MKPTAANITKFQCKIFSWWKDNRRNLPWRYTHDPYHILVSEVMLQQTQVSRVLPKYDEFLYLFPDVYALAHASTTKVLKVWKGLGYNRRALYLKKTAEAIVADHYGEFSKSELELIKLPGVGTYTARAILVFAYKSDVAMVDTNIRQIIVHYFFEGVPQKEKDVQNVADAIMPKGKSWEWHQALMDYGAAHTFEHQKKMTTPFKSSNRYIRGKIIDLLRENEWNEKQLVLHVCDIYGRHEDVVCACITGLLRDGLAQKTNTSIHLPM